MRKYLPGLTLAGIAALLLVACGGGGGGSPPSSGGTNNVAPIANAGANQSVTSGVTVTLNGTASSDADGSIASYAWTQTVGTPSVTLSSSTVAQPTFAAPTVTTATTFTFSLVVTDNGGASSAASSVSVTVNPVASGNGNVTGTVTFARVPFFSNVNQGLNYSGATQQPARAVTVRAIDAGSQAVLATGATDAQGNYSLNVAANTTMTIQVVAEMVSNTTPRWNVRVQDGAITTNTPYTYTLGGSFNSSAGGTHNVAIPTGISGAGVATGARASGPFAVLDTVYRGMQTVLGAAPTIDFPALVIDWGSQTEGTFYTAGGGAQHIALLADLTEDTDEFDQHVIAHEFGHYIEHNFSRADSIGGAHGLGDSLDIRVAFGEGFGYAFAAIVLNDPVARDSFVNGTTQVSGSFNVETNPPTSNNPACWCSESSVWSLLWDVYDSNADANDSVALGFAPLWDVLINAQRTTPAFTSIFSFMTALRAARPNEAAAIDTLVAAQQITTAGMDAFGSTETHVVAGVPSAASLPIYTTITLGTPVTVATSDDEGRHNKIGARRFFRFTPLTSRTVTITTSSSNTSNPDTDFLVYRSGTVVLNEDDPPAATETGTLAVTANTTYVLDVFDCANGCDTAQGTPGDYNLTVTIN